MDQFGVKIHRNSFTSSHNSKCIAKISDSYFKYQLSAKFCLFAKFSPLTSGFHTPKNSVLEYVSHLEEAIAAINDNNVTVNDFSANLPAYHFRYRIYILMDRWSRRIEVESNCSEKQNQFYNCRLIFFFLFREFIEVYESVTDKVFSIFNF